MGLTYPLSADLSTKTLSRPLQSLRTHLAAAAGRGITNRIGAEAGPLFRGHRSRIRVPLRLVSSRSLPCWISLNLEGKPLSAGLAVIAPVAMM